MKRRFKMLFVLSAIVLRGKPLRVATSKGVVSLRGCVVTMRDVFDSKSKEYASAFDASWAFLDRVGVGGAMRAIDASGG